MKTNSKTYPRKATSSEDKADTPYGYGFFFQPLQDYKHGILKLRSEHMLFEYLISMGEYWLNRGHERFWHSYATIHKRTGITAVTARKIVRNFEEEDFLTTEVVHERGRPITYYTIKYGKIAARMADIFGDIDTNHSPEQLDRIENRKRALKRMYRQYLHLKERRRTILS